MDRVGFEVGGIETGTIKISFPLEEFHLEGQHDQSSHGKGGGSKSSAPKTPASGAIDSKDSGFKESGLKGVTFKVGKEDEATKEQKASALKLMAQRAALGKNPFDHDISPTKLKKLRNEKLLKLAKKVAIPVALYGASYLIKSQLHPRIVTKIVGVGADRAFGESKIHTFKMKNGQVLKLADKTGKLTEDEGQMLLSHLNDVSKLHPLGKGKPPRIIVHGQHWAGPYFDAFVMGKSRSRTIHINKDVMMPAKGSVVDDMRKDFLEKNPDHMMPGFKTHGPRQTIFHEYGHIADFDSRRTVGRGRLRGKLATDRIHKKWKGPDSDLSKYGKTMPEEGYAEAFSEWHLTGGSTNNRATKAYGDKFGWKKTTNKPVTTWKGPTYPNYGKEPVIVPDTTIADRLAESMERITARNLS